MTAEVSSLLPLGLAVADSWLSVGQSILYLSPISKLQDQLQLNFVHLFKVPRGQIILALVTLPVVPPLASHLWFLV